MKWHSPSERTQNILIAPIAVPLALVAAAIILPAIGVDRLISAMLKPFRAGLEWSRWFAWRPVQTGDIWDDDRRWVWLETVERRNIRRVEYRLPAPPAVRGGD